LYQTKCTFNPTKNEGFIEIKLFARSELFDEIVDTKSAKLKATSTITTIVGLWFNIFPFAMSDLFRHKIKRLDRKKIPVQHGDRYGGADDDAYTLAIAGYPPISRSAGYNQQADAAASKTRLEKGLKDIEKLEKEVVHRHNKAVGQWKKATYASLEKDEDEEDVNASDSDFSDNDMEVETVSPPGVREGIEGWFGDDIYSILLQVL